MNYFAYTFNALPVAWIFLDITFGLNSLSTESVLATYCAHSDLGKSIDNSLLKKALDRRVKELLALLFVRLFSHGCNVV
jgi:hypothetical protein